MNKILIITTLWLLPALQGKAQFAVLTTFDTCQYLQQYEGEWRYANGADTIRVYMRFHRDYSLSYNAQNDNLYFWHEYKQGATIVESNYARRFDSLSYYRDDPSGVIYCSGFLHHPVCGYNSNRLTGFITDFSQSGEVKVVTAILDSTKTILTWKQRHSEGYGFTTGASGMTLPRQFILVKQ